MGGSDKLPAIGTGTNQISTGNQLANYLINDLQTESGFIMSSHTLEDNQIMNLPSPSPIVAPTMFRRLRYS